jgi:integrase
MATVFRRAGSDYWIASFRVWDAARGAWKWKQKGTGQKDRGKATAIAVTLESASFEAKAGRMTRAKAVKLVSDILSLAGCDALETVPSLSILAQDILSGNISDGTRMKYQGQWKALKEWAGKRVDRPVDTWSVADCGSYYDHLTKKHSATTTANAHLVYLSMLFERAVKKGFIANNPCKALDRKDNDTMEKEALTRGMTARILRACRRGKRKDWTALVALGWHTGHRLQDLLDIDASRIDGDLVTIVPRKKNRMRADDAADKKRWSLVLPLPRWLAGMVKRLGSFQSINGADNGSGKVSTGFVEWIKAAGVDPKPVVRGKRTSHQLTFHSFRHAMASRLTAAGVSGELARLVTDHESAQVQQRYIHSDITALRESLAKARRR